ncbi:MAG TPA: polyphosphate kinase 1 [Bryobacteraceae bacterium]|nr:polyphosphate kinase 1 [Bryobacteraceae bacterium]
MENTKPRKQAAKTRRITTVAPVAATQNAPCAVPLDDPGLYMNRELSLLEFQRRVLEEARDPRNRLLERVKFVSIVSSNLDEFFMVRVAAMKQKLEKGSPDLSIDGKTITEQLAAVRKSVSQLVGQIYDWFQNDLLPRLVENGIIIADYATLDDRERAAVDRYYSETIFPVLTPLAFDPGRPFPHISNLSLNLAIVLHDPSSTAGLSLTGEGRRHFARVKVPEALPQLVTVPAPPPRRGAKTNQPLKFVWIEQVIAANLKSLFPGLEIVESHPFHVTRDAEVAIQELESDDLLESVEEAVWRRRFRQAVRLQTDSTISDNVLEILIENLEITRKEVSRVPGPLDLARLRQLPQLDRPELRDDPFEPSVPADFSTHADEDMFTVIRAGDRLLHHPYESFQPVIDVLQKAARDPDVLAIKMTLYRVGRNSPIVQALLDAIENGKQVAVLVELKARFDEESNIEWARALEREGVHVVYGLVGLKVHCKIALIVRREHDGIRRYVHLGTGNYNAVTARLYTDFSLFTCDPDFGVDATDLFNYLTGYSHKSDFRRLIVAPMTLRKRMASLIRREMEHGSRGRLIFKMNALEDRAMIQLLYEASCAGVRVDLIVRGLCSLRPGIPGVSDNITVRSIVGRFLEHSRMYYFENGGSEEVYVGSADLMPRNLDRRVEILFPVLDPAIIRRLRHTVLEKGLEDNRKARIGKPDGTYELAPAGSGRVLDSQEWFIRHRGQTA